jgi:hypothetical protein
MRRVLAAALGCGAISACVAPAPASPAAGLPACPRDAAPDASGRCACAPGHAIVLGACVEPAVQAAYCGPAAVEGTAGACTFRPCAAGEALDTGGACKAIPEVLRTGPPCTAPATLIVTDDGRTACVPADAACPRGTVARGASCAAPVACPPGALPAGGECRPVVTAGPHGHPVVDVAAWATLVLGPSGGPGSSELCRPLQARPGAFGLVPGETVVLSLAVHLAAPDQDVSRVYATVSPRVPAGRALGQAGLDAARSAVTSLVEPLRGLGGEASSAAVEAEVRCTIASL